MALQNLSEQEIIRREKLGELKKLGIDPYPAALYPVNTYTTIIKNSFTEENKQELENVCLAGRLMSFRDMGKASFAELQDSHGRIQIYVRKDDLTRDGNNNWYNVVWKKLLDIGDFIGVKGFVFRTRLGEVSVHVQELSILSKSLRPFPIVKEAEGQTFDAVTDPEFKYRQRYADLVINPSIKETFIKRTKLINSIREFLNDHGALEVDTPVLQTIPGGAAARPFVTHHNALDVPFYLRIANELYLKRLIVGGFDWVYEFSRNFRNEGMDRTHNPEFTILEFYTAYKDYLWMMNVTERLLEKAAVDVTGSTEVHVGDLSTSLRTISFEAPFKRITLYDAIHEHTGHDVSVMDETRLSNVCRELGIEVEASMAKGKLIDEIFSKHCEHHYVQPTFIMDYPVEMSPLTKKHRSKPGLVERFELIINGKEIANAYTELNDPIDQRERFEEQVKLMERGDLEAMFIDNDFLRALEYGMPPTSGIGFGIDRLCMLLTNQPSIQDVLLFPQMRPEKWDEDSYQNSQV
ncbi:MAG: lysine--tRNA ligase [Chitinophagaceae bacterium]